MMRSWVIIVVQLLAVLALGGCSGSSQSQPSVPRPKAYHRISVPDPSYRLYDVDGVKLRVNEAVEVVDVDEAKGWLTARYPAVMATMYVTVNRFGEAQAAREIDNRIERLSLNTGGAPTEITSYLTGDGMEAHIITTRVGTPTPVQFLITDNKTVMISGSIEVKGAETAPRDSLAPVIDMLQRDVKAMLP